jgi:hypothetical protein
MTKYFSTIADETADISGIEQLSLWARYYDSDDGKMHEVFLTFLPIYEVNRRNFKKSKERIDWHWYMKQITQLY